MRKLPKMPKTKPRRLYEDHKPGGYLESFQDYADNNHDAVEWFLEHADEIRKRLHKIKV